MALGIQVGGAADETRTGAATPGWLARPMSLADALNAALQQNPAILAGLSDLEAAHGISVQTRAIALPHLASAAALAYDEARETSPFIADKSFHTPETFWNAGILLSQSVYKGGALVASVRAARLVGEEALSHYQTVVADIVFEVRTNYYGVLLAEQEILVQEASIKLLEQELATTQERFKAGAVPRFDVLRAEVAVANEEPKLITARDDFRVAKNDLVTMLGFDVPTNVWEEIPLQLSSKLEEEPVEIDLARGLGRALELRPELHTLRKERDLRAEGVKLAKAGYKPGVSVFAGYHVHSSEYHSDLFWTLPGPIAGVEMTWDIFDGNLTHGKVVEARALQTKADVNFEAGMRRILQEVRSAYSGFLRAREVLKSQKKVQEQADEALRLAGSRYDAGTSTLLDVLSAQTALTQARTTQVEAKHAYSVALAQWERASGLDATQRAFSKPPAK